jgi:uncharacterized RDD family membrane protein YckC
MEQNVTYAGFWKRFVAAWIDGFVMLLPTILLLWFQSLSWIWNFLTVIPLTFLFYAYEIYFHGRWGQTIGKRSQGIKVLSLDGTPITWKQAFLRSSVGLGLGVLSTISTLVALFRMSDEEFSSLSWVELSARQTELSPYINEIIIVSFIWFASEVVILLFNRKKRALHDFIAGTVVVEEFQPVAPLTYAGTEATE